MNEELYRLVFTEVLSHKFRDKGSPLARARGLNLSRDREMVKQAAREVHEIANYFCECLEGFEAAGSAPTAATIPDPVEVPTEPEKETHKNDPSNPILSGKGAGKKSGMPKVESN